MPSNPKEIAAAAIAYVRARQKTKDLRAKRAKLPCEYSDVEDNACDYPGDNGKTASSEEWCPGCLERRDMVGDFTVWKAGNRQGGALRRLQRLVNAKT